MAKLIFFVTSLAMTNLLSLAAVADEVFVDDFSGDVASRWEFIADRVMGGVSYGEIRFGDDFGEPTMTLSGTVSTENNGGFIQTRRALAIDKSEDYSGIILTVKGNGQRYFLHLRSLWTVLPWQYYQAGFETSKDWQEVSIPFAAFTSSSAVLPKKINPASVRSLGIVAFGRNHEADVSVREIRLY
tara:strand:+ start:352 stop:909 length:558 start_codon:yes stop_codon:yes gene_type:complete